jgi:serine/threonine protein kinase
MVSSQFSDSQLHFDAIEQIDNRGATCDSFRVKLYGKLHFLKQLKPEFAGDIRYQEALRKEFETGYRLEHPNLVRYISLDNNGILMEYVDGEILTQRLETQPDYFRNKKNTDKFLRQLLDVISYLHSHQVLHLDLKPDNILLTHINDDLKLVDLGFCYTDAFPDTTGHTNSYAAPEQLSSTPLFQGRGAGVAAQIDTRTDIYAIGRILELLPSHKYNKVIARCTAEHPSDRYQSVKEIDNELRHKSWNIYALTTIVIVLILLPAIWALYPRQHHTPNPVIQKIPRDTAALQPKDTLPQEPPVATPVPVFRQQSLQPSVAISKKSPKQMEKELDLLMDAAYRTTIATFCDSVFPSLTVGRQWEKASSEFHAQVLQTAADLSYKYPDIPESVVMELVESRFQSLVTYVFNRMRENGQNR